MKRSIWCCLLLSAYVAAGAARAECKGCEALCPLLDHYDQRKKGIDLWTKWASTNPNKSAPPPGVTDTESMERAFQMEFDKALAGRELPCELSLKGKLKSLLGMDQGSVADLETGMGSDCPIVWGGDRLGQGDTQQRYEASVGCKPLSDATIEHEKAHQKFCQDAWARDPATAPAYLDTPENVAESEREAWSRHKDELEKAIRDGVAKNGCGWEPTTGQLANPASIPSVHQVKKMQERMWRTNKELVEWLPSFQNTLP